MASIVGLYNVCHLSCKKVIETYDNSLQVVKNDELTYR